MSSRSMAKLNVPESDLGPSSQQLQYAGSPQGQLAQPRAFPASPAGSASQFAGHPHSPQASPQGGNYTYVPRKEDGDASAVNETPPRRYGCWQRVFLRHHNEQFADQAEFTFRSALCMVVMAIPFIMPKGHFEKVDWLIEQGYYSRSTVLMFLLTVDQTVGQTLSNAGSGLLGSLLSVANATVMHSVIPGGISVDTPWYVLFAVAAHGVLSVWLVLWLNFGMNARIFCLTTFAYHWMDFMNPLAGECNARVLCGPKVGEIIQACLACCIAVFCNFFPTPVFALRKARTNTRDVTAALNRAWVDVGAHFCGTYSAENRQDRLLADMHKIRTSLESIEGHLLNSWYEFGWFSSVRNIRESLARLRRTLQESSDRLFCTWNTCLQESFGGLHDDLMPRLWPSIQRVIQEASRLLTHCTEVACGGRVFDAEEPPLRDAAERTRAAVGALTAKFRETKAGLGIEGMREDLMDEHNFVIHICAFGRLAAELAEDLLAQKGSLRPLPRADSPAGIFDRAVLADKTHLSFAVRGLVTTLSAFLLGFFGHSKTMLKYDAGTAAFSALLLRKSLGCASARNLNRLHGVVVGTVMGHVIYSMIGWCTPWGYSLMSLAIFSWVATSLFQHHDGGRISAGLAVGNTAAGASAGMLAAYFGATGMMEECTEEVYTVLDVLGRSYYMIINSLTAVMLSFIVDSVLAPESASQLAARAYLDAWRCLSDALTDILDPRVLEVRLRTSELAHRLRVAEALGRQAEREPRYWRLPWRGALFGDGMQAALRLRMSICGMECSAVEGGRFGAGKAEKLRRFTSLPSFAPLRKVVQEKMEHMEGVFDSVVTQETGEVMRGLANPYLKRNFTAEYAQGIHAFILDANRLPEVAQDKFAGNTLESDVAAQASLILSCVASVLAEAQALQSAVLMRAF
mmetsp:Transcript_1195/g.2629  ORF Transcript_1195/g.2629 Transcript_1195/m.2629 type:complete len:913 (+) Transcript_1195:77-2815(+)